MERTALEGILTNLAQRAKELNLPASSVQIMSMVANTPADMLKGGRGGNSGGFAGRVTIRHKINGVIGTYWQNIANKFLAKSGSEESMVVHQRKWGTRIAGEPLVEHTTREGEYRLYLEFFPIRRLQAEYLVDGRPATPEEVESFKPFLKEKEKDSEITLTNGEKVRIPNIVRDYRLDHVEQILMMGEIATVQDDGSLIIHHRDGSIEEVGVLG